MESFAKSPFWRFIALAFVVSLFALAFAIGGGNTTVSAPLWAQSYNDEAFIATSDDAKTLVIWHLDDSRIAQPPRVTGSDVYTAK